MKRTRLHLCGSIDRRPFILLMTVSDLKIPFVGSGLLFWIRLKIVRGREDECVPRE